MEKKIYIQKDNTSVEEKMYTKTQFIEALVSYRLDPDMSIEQTKQRWPNTWNHMKEVCNEWFEQNVK